MRKLKLREYQETFKNKIVIAVIEIIVGILLLAIPTEYMLYGIYYIFGAVLILTAIYKFILNLNNPTIMGKYQLISAIFLFISGLIIMIINVRLSYYLFILGLVLIGIAAVRIVLSHNYKETLKNEVFQILVGIFLILFGISSIISSIFFIIKIIAGIVIIISAIFNLYFAYKEYKKERESDNILEASYKEIK